LTKKEMEIIHKQELFETQRNLVSSLGMSINNDTKMST
jgi:hypothetical protein